MSRSISRLARFAVVAGLCCGVVVAASAQAVAQDYPNRPIRLVLGFSPGGPTDIVARLLGEKLNASLGQQVVVDPRPGGASIIGTEIVARAPADGYTLGMHSASSTIHPSVYAKLPYNLLTDFVPITILTRSSYVLIVHPSVQAQSLQELIALAKEKDGSLNYAGAGIGDTLHLAGELMQSMGDFEMTLVPYGGGGPAITALLGAQTEVMISPLAIAIPQIKEGKVRPIAVTGPTRHPDLPDVPTVSEAGLPGYEVTGWYGLVAPAGTPTDIIELLNTEVNKALEAPDVRERLASIGMEPVGGTSEETKKFLETEIAKWAKVVNEAGIEKKSF